MFNIIINNFFNIISIEKNYRFDLKGKIKNYYYCCYYYYYYYLKFFKKCYYY